MNGPPKPKLPHSNSEVTLRGDEQKSQMAKAVEIARKVEQERYILLARELSARMEGFPFPGIEEESYARLKEDEVCVVDVGGTPIDGLIARFQHQGLKVMLSDDPKNLDVFIVPKNSSALYIKEDSILPRHLMVTADMDPDLRVLIQVSKEYKTRR